MLVPKLGLIWLMVNCGAFADAGVHKGPCFFLEMNECIIASEIVKEELDLATAPQCYYEEVGAEVG